MFCEVKWPCRLGEYIEKAEFDSCIFTPHPVNVASHLLLVLDQIPFPKLLALRIKPVLFHNKTGLSIPVLTHGILFSLSKIKTDYFFFSWSVDRCNKPCLIFFLKYEEPSLNIGRVNELSFHSALILEKNEKWHYFYKHLFLMNNCFGLFWYSCAYLSWWKLEYWILVISKHFCHLHLFLHLYCSSLVPPHFLPEWVLIGILLPTLPQSLPHCQICFTYYIETHQVLSPALQSSVTVLLPAAGRVCPFLQEAKAPLNLVGASLAQPLLLLPLAYLFFNPIHISFACTDDFLSWWPCSLPLGSSILLSLGAPSVGEYPVF